LQDESPSAHAEDESQPGVDAARLTEVAGDKHEYGSDEEAPEDASASWAARSEDEEELNHLERHGDGPVDVTVDDGTAVVGDPVFTHVEIMDSCDEGDQGSDGQ